jgi:hypothetical protein
MTSECQLHCDMPLRYKHTSTLCASRLHSQGCQGRQRQQSYSIQESECSCRHCLQQTGTPSWQDADTLSISHKPQQEAGGSWAGHRQLHRLHGNKQLQPQCKTEASIQTLALKHHQCQGRVCLTTAAICTRLHVPRRKQRHTRPV